MQRFTAPTKIILLTALVASTLIFSAPKASAALPIGDFSIEISPAILVSNIQPGTSITQELKIRNNGLKTEKLKIETRSFSTDQLQKNIRLSDTTPPYLAKWVSYSQPTFELAAKQVMTQSITVRLPLEAGFSYEYALLISRADSTATYDGGQLIKGSVAVFSLMNVEKPGSVRKLEIEHLSTNQQFYEYLPASIDLKLKNTGNGTVQPYGTIYIQRGSSDSQPLNVLPVNEANGYVLPGKTRVINVTWNDGFPHYETTRAADGKDKSNLVWNWGSVANLRIGYYTARVVAVYNDGRRDIPLSQEVGFWVIPWRILLVALAILALVIFAVWSIVVKIIRGVKKFKK